MVIKASSRAQIDSLIGDLGSDRAVTRETAITRLTVIGARALDRLMSLVGNPAAEATARVAALRILEATGNARSLDAVLHALDDPNSIVAAAAAGAARAFLRGPHGAAAVDRLTALALDRQREEATRVAAIRALSDLEPSTVAPLFRALVLDPNTAIAALASHPDDTAAKSEGTAAWLATAIEGGLSVNPETLRRSVSSAGNSVSLALLHTLIERLGERERVERPQQRAAWTAARGAAHAALAARGSRVALYDLRETLSTANEPLPVDFLAALREVGDPSCLEAVAAAYSQMKDEWWRGELVVVFRNLAAGAHITRRHAVMKRIAKRWPAILDRL